VSQYHLDLSKPFSVVPSLKDVTEYVEMANELLNALDV